MGATVAYTGPCGSPSSGCNAPAPLNVGLNNQTKLGSLFLNAGTSPMNTALYVMFGTSTFKGKVQITDGSQGAGKVFTSDASGVGSWQTASGGSQWISAGSNLYYNNGNVGVGTTTPVTKLEVAGTVKANSFRITGGSPAAGKVLTATNTSGDATWQDAANDGVPTGAIIMFDKACPTGWTRFSTLDGKVPRGAGASVFGVTGGSESHSHGVPYSVHTEVSGGSWRTVVRGDVAITTDAQSNWPPYVNVVWCKKN